MIPARRNGPSDFAGRRQQAWEMIADGHGSIAAARWAGISEDLAGAMAVKRDRLEAARITPPITWTEAATIKEGPRYAGVRPWKVTATRPRHGPPSLPY